MGSNIDTATCVMVSSWVISTVMRLPLLIQVWQFVVEQCALGIGYVQNGLAS